jgi:5'-3' exonuclease
MGDKSDNLAGIKGLGPKKIAKVIPEIVGKEINLDYLMH